MVSDDKIFFGITVLLKKFDEKYRKTILHECGLLCEDERRLIIIQSANFFNKIGYSIYKSPCVSIFENTFRMLGAY